ncbi:MAG: hypothetical protein KUG61_08395 [Parvibaculaceae bacterium]|nr:hypothetical protein [Parvibaculaceae bacterium]
MSKLSLAILCAGATLLGACSQSVNISTPNIPSTAFASQNVTPGRYAVTLQTGGWSTEVKTKGWTCSAWDFPADFNGGYAAAIQSAMQQTFEHVEFVADAVSKEDLNKMNLDAHIYVYQGNLASNFGVESGLFTATMTAEVQFDGTVAVTSDAGLHGQTTVTGHGSGAAESMIGCDKASDSIQQAGGQAMKDFIIEAVNAAKLNVIELRLQAHESKTPTS